MTAFQWLTAAHSIRLLFFSGGSRLTILERADSVFRKRDEIINVSVSGPVVFVVGHRIDTTFSSAAVSPTTRSKKLAHACSALAFCLVYWARL